MSKHNYSLYHSSIIDYTKWVSVLCYVERDLGQYLCMGNYCNSDRLPVHLWPWNGASDSITWINILGAPKEQFWEASACLSNSSPAKSSALNMVPWYTAGVPIAASDSKQRYRGAKPYLSPYFWKVTCSYKPMWDYCESQKRNVDAPLSRCVGMQVQHFFMKVINYKRHQPWKFRRHKPRYSICFLLEE